METLGCLIEKAQYGGFINDFKIEDNGKEGIQVSHLLFADDTFLFYEDNVVWLKYWNRAVTCFEVMSGLKINMQKS